MDDFEAFKANMKTRSATCQRHGIYQSENPFGNIWLGCGLCEEEDLAMREVVSKQRAAKQEKSFSRARIAAVGIPERLRDKTLECYSPVNDQARAFRDAAIHFAKCFGDNNRRGQNLFLLGTMGTGKTHVACGIARYLAEKGQYRPIYTTLSRALVRVKGTWSRDANETQSEVIGAFVGADLLVLDEVGIQFGTDTERNIIFDILNERYERRKSTILISNLMLEGVTDCLGERVIDRLREDGAKVFTFTWGSFRHG